MTREEIFEAAKKKNATIIAVTKYFGAEKIIEYYDEGFRNFGENRVVEAAEKINSLPEKIRQNSKFHLIGHLQTNKAKKAVGVFDLIHSVDSLKLAGEISKIALEKGIKQKILIQINNANEEQKFGVSPLEVEELFKEVLKLDGVEIKGLMTIAPLGEKPEKLRELFGQIRQIKENLESTCEYRLEELSMGMSDDWKIALEEGATMIRLGRILFKEIV